MCGEKMALLKYFSKEKSTPCAPPLSLQEKETVKDFVRKSNQGRGRYNDYSSEERAAIGRYTAENGPAKASRHFSKTLERNVPESTARKLRDEYLKKLKEVSQDSSASMTVKSLPTKRQGRPLLLGQTLDETVQRFISDTRKTGGVINTTVVVATARGIVSAKDPSLLRENGGPLDITSAWAKSLMKRMGYVKRKCSNAGKITLENFEEIKEEFLADVKAEVLMNEIPLDLVFNWDQTGIQLVPTGEWTMHQAKDKIIPISHSDDKRQITGVFAVTAVGRYLPVQLIYKGKTERCHPKVTMPAGWDLWHSDNHWSTESTMIRYIEKVIVPFVDAKRAELKLSTTYPALAIFDCFTGQTTPAVKSLLRKHHIRFVIVPPNCTDKLQPLDISVNKPIKGEMKKRYQMWYAEEVQKLLMETPAGSVKVDLPAAIIKHQSGNWIVSAWNAIQDRPEIAINGFKKAGILDAILSLLT